MRVLYIIICFFITWSILSACSNAINNQHPKKNNFDKDSSVKITKAVDGLPSATTNLEEQKSENFIGRTVNSIDDLLDLIYPTGKPALVESDTVNMSIAEIIGNDTLKIIYLNGESDLPSFGHTLYLQSVVFIRKNLEGWEIMDVSLNQTTFDYSSVEFAGIFGGRMLTRYLTNGSYAGGVSFSSIEYTWHEVNSLSGASISFIRERSNTASEQCLSDPDGGEKKCDCYSSEGTEKFKYDVKLNCLVFDYKYKNTTFECEMKNPETEFIAQKWYMNDNITLLAKGNALSEYGEHILEKVNLSEKEILEALKNKE